MTARKRDHVHQAANGTWSFVIDAPSATAKRRQLYRRGFATKKAALAALDKLRTDLAKGVFVEPSKLTVGVYLNEQWLPIAESRVRPTTAASYRMIVRRWIVPTIGAVPLQLLDRARVARWVVELSRAGLAAKSVRNVHVVLRKALADALELGLVQRNAAEKTTTLPNRPAPSPRAWSVEQLGRFLDGTADDRLATVWRFLATTGCRRGEVLGLRWADVDLEHAGVTITNQRTVADGHVVEGPVKTTSGARTIALDAQTIAVLRAWRKVQTAERLVMGTGWPDTGLVFTNVDGSGIWPQRLTSDFKLLCERLELPAIGVHGLRHTAATWLISTGQSPRVVQQRLGHAHVSITLGLYAHVTPAHDRAAANNLADAIDSRS